MPRGRLSTLLLTLLTLSIVSGFSPLYYLLYTLTFAMALGYLWAWFQTYGLQIEVENLTSYPRAGESLRLRINVHEKLGLPRINLSITFLTQLGTHKDIALDIPSRGSVSHITDVVAQSRGWNQIGIVTVMASDPLGLVKVTKKVGEWASILVYPRTLALPRGLISGYGVSGEAMGDGILSSVGQSASQLREYATGDGINRIHWPSTARLGRLMTKTFDSDGSRQFVIFLNFHSVRQVGFGGESTEEYMVTLGASLGRSLSEQGQAVGMVVSGDNTHQLIPARGWEHLLKLLRSMAIVRATGQISLLDVMMRESKDLSQGTVALIISPWEGEDISPIYRYAAQRNWVSVPILLDNVSFRQIGDSQWLRDRRQELQGRALFVYRGDDLSSILSAVMTQLGS